MNGWSRLKLPVPGNIYYPPDIKALKVPAVMIGDYDILVPVFCQRLHLTQYSHMASPIGKKGSWDYIEDFSFFTFIHFLPVYPL